MRKIHLFLLFSLLFVLFFLKIGWEEKERFKAPPTGEVVYWLAKLYPEQAFLGGIMVSLGYKEALSDLFFLQAIQYFGAWEEEKEKRYQRTYPILRAIGKLSPYFVEAYSFGALVMEESGHTNDAIDFLNEGIKNNPPEKNPKAWDLVLYRDLMIYLRRTHEYEKAIRNIKILLQRKDHPPILDRILAHAYELNGQIKEAILQWKNIYLKEENPHIKGFAVSNIKRLFQILKRKEGERKAYRFLRREVLRELPLK